MPFESKPSGTLGMIDVLEFALLFDISIIARSAFLEHEPIHDELSHCWPPAHEPIMDRSG